MYGRFALMAGLFLGSFPMTSCDDDAVTTEYQPLPKLTLDEPFQYECTDANLVSFTPDSLTRVAVLNFLKEDVTDLDYVDYDGMSVCVAVQPGMHPNDRNVSLTFHQFHIEDIGGTDETQARLR